MKKLLFIFIILFIGFNIYSQMPTNNFKFQQSNVDDAITSNTAIDELNRFVNSIGKKVMIDSILLNVNEVNSDEMNLELKKFNEALSNIENLNASSSSNVAAYISDIINYLSKNMIIMSKYNNSIAKYGNEMTGQLNDYSKYINQLQSIKQKYKSINRITGKPFFKNRFVPALNPYALSLIYNKYGDKILNFGQNISLFGWAKEGSVNAELASFYVQMAKVSINTIVTSTDSLDDNAAMLRTLTGGGGNGLVNIDIPFFHFGSKHFMVFSEVSAKFAMNIPVFGTPFKSNDVFLNFHLGGNLNINYRYSDSANSPSFYAYSRFAYINGADSYLSTMKTNTSFHILQTQVGVDIPNIGRFGLTLPTASNLTDLKDQTWLLSYQVSPQKLLKK